MLVISKSNDVKKLTANILSPLTLLDHYKGIEDCSRQMLDAACTANWKQLALLSGNCGALIARLSQSAPAGNLNSFELQEKKRILQRILRTDAQIRCLAEPALARYERYRGNAGDRYATLNL